MVSSSVAVRRGKISRRVFASCTLWLLHRAFANTPILPGKKGKKGSDFFVAIIDATLMAGEWAYSYFSFLKSMPNSRWGENAIVYGVFLFAGT